MMNPRSLALTPLLASLIATVALVACNRAEEPRTAGQVLDQTVTQVENKAKEIGADMRADMRAGGEKAADAVAVAGTKTADAVRDAAITVEVKAMLAKDPGLSALRIDVDTTAGRVALRGTAPTAAARERASHLAKAVTGVTGVNNELSVKAGS